MTLSPGLNFVRQCSSEIPSMGGLGYRNEIRARRLPETRKIIRAKPILEIRRANPDIAVGITIDDSIRDPSRPRIWIGPDESR
jgi:hypothetical protein